MVPGRNGDPRCSIWLVKERKGRLGLDTCRDSGGEQGLNTGVWGSDNEAQVRNRTQVEDVRVIRHVKNLGEGREQTGRRRVGMNNRK